MTFIESFNTTPFKFPYYTNHFLERYTERIFNVPENRVKSYIKFNKTKIFRDIKKRLNYSNKINFSDNEKKYIRSKHTTDDCRFYKNNNIVFVVRFTKSGIYVKTCFNVKHNSLYKAK